MFKDSNFNQIENNKLNCINKPQILMTPNHVRRKKKHYHECIELQI